MAGDVHMLGQGRLEKDGLCLQSEIALRDTKKLTLSNWGGFFFGVPKNLIICVPFSTDPAKGTKANGGAYMMSTGVYDTITCN